MVRGYRTFICTECGQRFKALDVEYLCTDYSMPYHCPLCHSIRTRPVSLWPHLEEIGYRKIWNFIEEKEKEAVDSENNPSKK